MKQKNLALRNHILNQNPPTIPKKQHLIKIMIMKVNVIQLTQNAIQLTHTIHKTNIEDHITANLNISTKIQNNDTTSHKTLSNLRSNPQRLTKERNPQKNGQPTRCNICKKVSTIGPLNAQIKTLMKSVVWSMKLFSKIVVTQRYKYYYLKLGLLLFLTPVLVDLSICSR